MKIDINKLYTQLKRHNEAKEIFFNDDREMVFDLLEALVLNKERYGYMACPCRLACGDKQNDRDIICPCDYREPDLEEYGECFCGLYISRDLHENKIQAHYVPERRPPEKIF